MLGITCLSLHSHYFDCFVMFLYIKDPYFHLERKAFVIEILIAFGSILLKKLMLMGPCLRF